jgi:hypothetical protein
MIIKAPLEHAVDNGFQSRVNCLLVFFTDMTGLCIVDPQLGVMVYTLS